MTRDEIALGFRMVAMGRPNQEAAEKLIDALAALLADPAERLAAVVVDEPAAEPAKRGRPRKDQA
jgi:hypothetical protein